MRVGDNPKRFPRQHLIQSGMRSWRARSVVLVRSPPSRGRGAGRCEDIAFRSNEPRCSKAGLVLHRDPKRDH